MIKALTNKQMRQADAFTMEKAGVSSETLMKRAGKSLADVVFEAYNKLGAKCVLVVCGTGNNAGDGYVCANELSKRNVAVKIFCLKGNLSRDCAREKWRYKGEYAQSICGDIIVDCIFGTGLTRQAEGLFAETINKINSSGAFVISADIPSGLNGDNGKILNTAVKSDVTVAIGERKFGFYLNDGPDYCGKIIKKDIGIVCGAGNYARIYEDCDIAKFYPKRKRNSHKGTYGVACLFAGSDKYIGAAALSLEAALKSGCGYVKMTSTDKVTAILAAKFPQTIFGELDLNSNCIAIGMGCGVSEDLYKRIKFLLKNYGGTLLIDADGLNALSKYGLNILKEKICSVIVTPHLKEFSRMTGEAVEKISDDPIYAAEKFAKEYCVTVLLKSTSSIISNGEDTVINIRGNSALSKAGSGDMLSGYICGCVARGLSPFDSAVCGAYTVGLAAEISAEQKTEYCATANDIIKNLPFAVKRLTSCV